MSHVFIAPCSHRWWGWLVLIESTGHLYTQVPGFYGWVDLVVCGLVDSLTIEHAAPDPWFGPEKGPQVDHPILTEAELWLWLWPGKDFYRRNTIPNPQQFARKGIIGDWTFPGLKGPENLAPRMPFVGHSLTAVCPCSGYACFSWGAQWKYKTDELDKKKRFCPSSTREPWCWA